MSNQTNSRLGRVLVNRGFITEAQLDYALEVQGKGSQRLGEILLEKNWITQGQLNRALKRQSLIRKAGALATVVCAPLHSVTGFAATMGGAPVMPTKRADVAEQTAQLPSGLVPMSDSEMSSAAAQGPLPFGSPALLSMNYDGGAAALKNRFDDDEEEDQSHEEQVAKEALDSVASFAGFGPISSMIDADITVTGFERIGDMPAISVLEDGAVRISTAYKIDQVAFENMRVAGSNSDATFGSIYMTDIEYAAGSNMVIRANDDRW